MIMDWQKKTFILLLLMASIFISVIAQDKRTQISKRPISNTSRKLPPGTKIPKNDLVISDFNVDWNAGHIQSIYYTAPFSLNVRNIGLFKLPEMFHVALQYSTQNNPTFQGENSGDNCFVIPVLLSPNETYTLRGMLKVASGVLSEGTIKIRAIADFECLNEFPAPNGKISESNEDNNFSNEVEFTGRYLPNLEIVYPELCIKGVTECELHGSGLTSHNGNYTIVLEQNGMRIPVVANSWSSYLIKFSLPPEIKVGKCRVYIAEIGSLIKVSDIVEFNIGEVTSIPWADILSPLDLASLLFNLRLHTWSGTSTPANQSEFTFPNMDFTTSKMPIDIPNIQLETSVGHYRFMLNDMATAPSLGFVFNRTNCTRNQFRLNIHFESEGKEIVGYYKVLGPAGQWRREGAPDIHIDSGDLDNVFSLYDNNGTLNYSVDSKFSGKVDAANNVENWLMDTFISNWDSNIKSNISYNMKLALNSQLVKPVVLNALMGVIRNRLPNGSSIVKIEFTNDALLITNR